MDALSELLDHIRAQGEGPTLEIRPYDSGRVRVWVWVPDGDGMRDAAQGAGEDVQAAAQAALARLRGTPVCAWCDAVSKQAESWRAHTPTGAWTCPACQ